MAGVIGINSYGIGVHGWGAGHNVGVLDGWNAPAKRLPLVGRR